jgi:GAF domain-containing protein
VIRTNTSLLTQDVETHEKFRLLSQEYPGLECLIVVPLRAKNLEIGALTVYGYEDRDTLTQSDVEFVSSLASQVSIALANIALTNQRIQEEQVGMIGQIATHIMPDLNHSLLLIRDGAERIGSNESDPGQRQQNAQLILEEIDRIKKTIQELWEHVSEFYAQKNY